MAQDRDNENDYAVGTGLAIDLKDLDLKVLDLDLSTLSQRQDQHPPCVNDSAGGGGLGFLEGKKQRKTRKKRLSPLPEKEEDYIAYVKKFHDDLPDSIIDDWKDQYGELVNVEATLFVATIWLIQNTNKRKKDIKKYYHNWIRNQYMRTPQYKKRQEAK